jgi:TolB-like protein/Flp pilus assembly protein TadD
MLLVSDILNRDPEPPSTLDPQLPPGLEKVILKALEKDPAHRYQSARELGDDLARLTAGMPPLARLRRRSMSSPIVASVAVASLAAALGAYLLLAHRGASTKTDAVEAKPSAAEAAAAEPTSIAVLPFVNMSPDPDQEYFSDGLSEELLNSLANVPQLRVISRTSSFQFKGKSEDVRTIARKLNVAHVLEGSVRKSGKHVRITAQLVDAGTGSHLWSQTYDRDLEDIFAIQNDIARSVANASRVTLLGSEGKPSFSHGSNAEAYNLFLQAKHHSRRGTRESLEKAIGYYQRALKLEPGRATYWAGLAGVHMRQATEGFIPEEEGFGKSRMEVTRALELDPNMSEAHASLGYIRLTHDWDWEGASASLKQALKNGPGSSLVVGAAASVAAALGRFDESIELNRRAIRLDPLNIAPHFNLGEESLNTGRLDEAEAAFRKVLELNPDLPGIHEALGRTYLLKGKPEAALDEYQKEKHPADRRYGLALAYHDLGPKSAADSALAELVQKDGDGAAVRIAEVYAYRRDPDKAFEWLGRAHAQRNHELAFVKGEPFLRNLERDPRYEALLRTMKLPQ